APGDEVFSAQADYGLHERDVMNDAGWPKMAFIEHRLANDPTNWWAPNHACIEAMLRSTGFTNIQKIAHEIYRCEANVPVSVFAQQELTSVTQAGDSRARGGGD